MGTSHHNFFILVLEMLEEKTVPGLVGGMLLAEFPLYVVSLVL